MPSKEDGFNKEQLVSEDVFILDTYSCIFVWVSTPTRNMAPNLHLAASGRAGPHRVPRSCKCMV